MTDSIRHFDGTDALAHDGSSWVEGQHVGILATATMASIAARNPDVRDVRQPLVEWAAGFTNEPSDRQLQIALALPPSTLIVLHECLRPTITRLGRTFPDLTAVVTKALTLLDQPDERLHRQHGLPFVPGSPLAYARRLAAFLMSTDVPMARIGYMAIELTSPPRIDARDTENPWWAITESPALLDDLDRELQALRSPNEPTSSRIHAVLELSRALGDTPYWSQVEHALLARQFAWPLLVLPGARGHALSVPVAVDVQWKSNGSIETVPVRPTGSIHFDDSFWSAMRSARHAAVGLWRSKHGHFGEMRGDVERAGFRLDLRVANAILSEVHLLAEGSSAGASFAMAMLGEFLGVRSGLATAITGVVGEQIPDDDLPGRYRLDWRAHVPSGLQQKARFAFRANSFERLVIPHPTSGDEDAVDARAEIGRLFSDLSSLKKHRTVSGEQAEESFLRQTASVVPAGPRLSDIADAVHASGWRQHDYVRCPDIRWAVHSDRLRRPGLLGDDNERVVRLYKSFSLNTNGVVDLRRDGATPLEVASALWHLNTSERMSIPGGPPPTLSWLFLRAVRTEQDNQFWETFYAGIGASKDRYRQFCDGLTLAEATEQLANDLNEFEPPIDARAHRSPDVIVIVDADVLDDPNSIPPHHPRTHTALGQIDVLGERGLLLRSRTATELDDVLGHTRIVLVTTPPVAPSRPPAVLSRLAKVGSDTSEIDAVALWALATFRHGFTEPMAAMMLGKGTALPASTDVGAALDRLVDGHDLNYGQGWYHIPRGIHEYLNEQVDRHLTPEVLARRELAAALALAPQMNDLRVPSLALDAAFHPAHQHEARYHFERALRLAPDSDWTVRNEANRGRNLLDVASSGADWSTIGEVIGNSRLPRVLAGYALGRELLGVRRNIHAGRYSYIVDAARHALILAQHAPDGVRAHLVGRLESEILGPDGIVDRALSTRPALDVTGVLRDLGVASRVAELLNAYCRARSGHPDSRRWMALRDELDAEVAATIQVLVDDTARDHREPIERMAETVLGSWFLRYGERLPKAAALRLYEVACRAVPSFDQLWLVRISVAPARLTGPIAEEMVDIYRSRHPESRWTDGQILQMILRRCERHPFDYDQARLETGARRLRSRLYRRQN